MSARIRHEPYIPDSTSLPELTPLPLAVGTLLGVVFGASSLYLVLKVGLTVSASIPVAVISIALFRAWSKVSGRDANILEHNIVQTAGSAGESIAFGLGSTMPAILILGFDLEITRVALVGVLGGLLGILMMIPLRRALIVEQHGELKFPEGTACAEVLKAGASAESRAAASDAARREEAARGGAATSAAAIFTGFAIGLAYKTLNVVFRLWKDIPEKVFGAPFTGGSISAEISPELLGVGYIIGPYIGSLMCAGGVLAYLVVIPAIKFFGGGLAAPLAPRPISVVAGGSIALVVAIMLATPLHMNVLGASLIVVLGFLFTTVSSRLTGEVGSSSNPISGMTVATLLITCLAFLLVGWVGPTYYVTALSVGAIVCIACSNGGTTSQDLKTGFLVGATPRHQQVAILVGALTSALLLGPILLQLNESATVYVPQATGGAAAFPATMHVDPATLTGRQMHDSREYRVWFKQDAAGGPAGKYFVDDAGTPVFLVNPGINGIHTTTADGHQVTKFDAPKATLMSYIIKGILNRQLPWELVLLGVTITLVLEMSAVPSLAFAVGVYLPLSTSAPIFVGGMVRWLADHLRRTHAGRALTEEELVAEGDRGPGVLLASGYIAGGALAGIGIAFTAGLMDDFTARIGAWAEASNPLVAGGNADLLSLVPFVALCVVLYLVARGVLLAPRREA